MKPKLSLTLLALVAGSFCFGQSFISRDLPLYNVVTDDEITIDAFESHKAVVMVFTSIHCPYAKLYKDRVRAMSMQYEDQNVRFVFVNANATDPANKETLAHMKDEANTINENVQYFADQNQVVCKSMNVQKNPEVIILTPSASGYKKVYQGAIDDSPQSESLVRQNYVQITLNSLLANQAITVAYQRPVGCRIR